MSAAGSIAFVLKGYPRLSETFIAQEILGIVVSGGAEGQADLYLSGNFMTFDFYGQA